MDVVGKSGPREEAGAWGPGERQWGPPMEEAVVWEKVDGFQGYFGGSWDMGGAY